MKVKNLILALGVTGAFVACSQEELVDKNQNLNSDRPVVGAIEVKLDQGVESRWAYSNGFTFEATDYMGACLMDEVVTLAPGTAFADKYSLVNTISTNYKYGYKDNWTNGDAIMSEGNYFFYMPYNSALKGRAGLTYNLAADQYAYDKTAETPVHNGNKSWLDNQMFVGYDAVLAGDQQATPNLVEVFAKPRFNVNYIGTKNVVVERIVVMNENEKFAVKGQLDVEDVTASVYNALNPAIAAYQVAAGKTVADVFAMYNKAVADVAAGDLELAEGQKLVNPLAALGLLAASAADAVPSISLNVVPAKEVSALMVMPAGQITAANTTIQVYTNVGWVVLNNISADLAKPAVDTDLTYENITKLYNLRSGDGVKADAVEINFGDKDITVPTEVTVATTSQLESVMRWYATTSDDFVLEVNIATGANVELTSKVYDIIKGNEELTVEFKGGKLTIPATAEADAWSIISLDQTTSQIVNKGTQDITNNAALTVGYPILNQGVLNVSALNTTTKTISFSANVQNQGEVNVLAGKVNFGTFSNQDNLTVNAGATFVATTLVNDAMLIPGTLNYENASLITNNGTMYFGGYNEVTIENNGKIYLDGAFENKFKDAVTTGANKTNGYKGEIKNNLATSYLLAKDATLINNSYIYNYGFIYSQGTGVITNNKYVKANDGSTTYVTTNAAAGEIELQSRDTETTVNTNNGLTSYTLTAADLTNGAFKFETTSDKFNTLRVGINVKFVDGTHAPENLILTGATVSCPTVLGGTAAIKAPSFTSVKAESGVNVIKGIQVNTSKLTVSSGALLQIPSLSSFGVTTSVANGGEILVGGLFNGKSTLSKTGNGIYSSAGTGSYVWTWGGTW